LEDTLVTSQFLSNILKASKCHSASAFTENILKAAIEAGDHVALSQLPDIRSLNIDSIVCVTEGRRYTAIGRAVYLHHVGVGNQDYRSPHVLVEAIKGRDIDFVRFIVSSKVISTDILTYGLGAAFSINEIEMVRVLIELGADPFQRAD
jgi:hypothetical protein